MRCFEDAAKAADKAPDAKRPAEVPAAPSHMPSDDWRLVRTPDPRGGPEAVSIMHTPDLARSDIDFAGLMLRCRERDFEVAIVLLKPFPPRAHPKAKLTANGRTREFTTSVIPPGAAIALPAEATALANGPWQSASELAVEVAAGDGDDSTIRGVVSLAGLGPAVARLTSSCPRVETDR